MPDRLRNGSGSSLSAVRRLLLVLSAAPALAWAAPTELGKHPLCEASAALLVACPDDAGRPCLLVGDNEERTSLFLFQIEDGRVQPQHQQKIDLDLDEETELSDIEALTQLADGRIGLFASHSRNSRCKQRPNRRRFGVIDALAPEPVEVELVQSEQIACGDLFDDGSAASPVIAAVCERIDEAKTGAEVITEARQARRLTKQQAKATCNVILPYNAEGAVNLGADGPPDLWIGLRAPLLAEHPGDAAKTELAILLHLEGFNAYRFDRAALLDLGGRGVRDLTVSDGSVWLIAGPPHDLPDGAAEPFQLRRFDAAALTADAVIEPELIADDLPASSEGLVILDGQALIVIDGDAGDADATECATPSRIETRRVGGVNE
jgi:hypothetical protein